MALMRRIACLLPNLAGGGQERVTLNLLRGLTQQGYETDLVLADLNGPYQDRISSQIRVINLRQPIENRALSTLQLTSPLVRYLRQEAPDILISHLVWTNECAVLANTLAGFPSRLMLWEQMPPTQPPTQLKITAMRSLYRWANAIVTPSQGVADYYGNLLNLSPLRITVIPNPVVDATLQQQAIAPLDHPWFAPDQPPVILGIGRLTPQKDFSTLIRAFAQLIAQQPARLMILGEGGKRQQLETLIQELNLTEFVSLPGFVANPYAYLSRAALFVLSSQREGLPTVLIEALACGCAVVSTDCPHGPRDILDNGRYGSLVPVGDVSALAEAMQTTLAQPLDREELQARSQDFEIHHISDRFIRLAQRIFI